MGDERKRELERRARTGDRAAFWSLVHHHVTFGTQRELLELHAESDDPELQVGLFERGYVKIEPTLTGSRYLSCSRVTVLTPWRVEWIRVPHTVDAPVSKLYATVRHEQGFGRDVTIWGARESRRFGMPPDRYVGVRVNCATPSAPNSALIPQVFTLTVGAVESFLRV